MEVFQGFSEPHFTQTPNLIFDQLMKNLSGSQLKVLLVIVRRTFGFHRSHEFTPVSIEAIREIAGLSNRAVIDAIEALMKLGLILRNKDRDAGGRAVDSSYRVRFLGESSGLDLPSEESSLRTLSEESSCEVFSGNLEKSSLREPLYHRLVKETTIKNTTKDIPRSVPEGTCVTISNPVFSQPLTPPKKPAKKTTEAIRAALGSRLEWWTAFWSVYPCHQDPRSAMEAFERTATTRDIALAMYQGARRYSALVASDPHLKVKYGQGWINSERWLDENKLAPPLPVKLSSTDRVMAIMQERINRGEAPL